MKKLNKKGTSIIELILYIAISAFVLLDIAGMIGQIVATQMKVEVIAREDETARNVMRLISQSIQEAQTINSPNYVNASATTLSLTDQSGNTIQYYLSGSTIYKQVNTNTAAALTSADVSISTLSFTVESEAGVSPSINIKIEIQRSVASNTNQAHYETTAAQRKL